MKTLLIRLFLTCVSIPLFTKQGQTDVKDPSHYRIKTSQGKIAIWDSRPFSHENDPTVIFIHGHCTNKKVFAAQMHSPLLAQYRLICLDLPGYGKSDPPSEPEKTYSFPGYADVTAEVIHLLGLKNIVIVGWSLGGHVGLELTSRLSQLKGLVITGTPPIEISIDGITKGFRIGESKALDFFGKGNLSWKDAAILATIFGYDYSEEKRFLVEGVMQTDEGAKTIYPQSLLKGIGQNELTIVKNWPRPIAVILGAEEAAIKNAYILNEVEFGNLWSGKIHVIKGAAHGVHMEKPDEFNFLLKEFFQDIFENL